MASKKSKKGNSPEIAQNRRAFHDYFIEERFEAGVALEGWEVKSLRAGRGNIKEAYILIRNGEAYLVGAHFSPLSSASTHIYADPTRTRRLLLHRREIDRLIGATERQGYTVVPLSLYWKRGMAKLEIALARGKKKYDKRAAEKEKDWQRQRARILKETG